MNDIAMSSRGVLTVLSGFSGSGKGTVVKRLVSQFPERYALSISATTRSPRKNEKTGVEEIDGVDYFFLSEEEFQQKIAEEALIEYANYNGNYYGTPKDYVFSMLEEGKDVLLEIEVQGALQVKKRFPETLLVFMTPPSVDELKKRLLGRGTETEEVIAGRMNMAKQEVLYMDQYDYILVNEDVEDCVQRLHHMIDLQHQDAFHSQPLIAAWKQQLL